MSFHYALSSALLVVCGLFACGTPEQNSAATVPTTDSSAVIEPKVTDGHRVYTDREIDSLKYTAQAASEDGIYVVLRRGRSIDLLPVEPYEHMTNLKPACVHPDSTQASWLVYHRIDRVPIQTASRPMKLTSIDSGYVLKVPFDGATASRVSALREKWVGHPLTVLHNGKSVGVFEDDALLNVEGVSLFATNREVLSNIKKAFE